MTKQSTQKVSAKRMDALNQRVGPFAEERARYIKHLCTRGWARYSRTPGVILEIRKRTRCSLRGASEV
jgi:hypothetical protein